MTHVAKLPLTRFRMHKGIKITCTYVHEPGYWLCGFDLADIIPLDRPSIVWHESQQADEGCDYLSQRIDKLRLQYGHDSE